MMFFSVCTVHAWFDVTQKMILTAQGRRVCSLKLQIISVAAYGLNCLVGFCDIMNGIKPSKDRQFGWFLRQQVFVVKRLT